jgi:hypothetical protein
MNNELPHDDQRHFRGARRHRRSEARAKGAVAVAAVSMLRDIIERYGRSWALIPTVLAWDSLGIPLNSLL